MRQIVALAVITTCALAITSCAEMQVKRDLTVEEDKSTYIAGLAGATDFKPEHSCTLSPAIKHWQPIPFSEQTPIYKLPNGLSAAAYCVKIPNGAKAFELYGAATGGTFFYQLSIVHPSVIGLDHKFTVLDDIQYPKMIPSEGWSEFRISGITPIRDKLQNSVYLVIYVHPNSFQSGVDVLIPGERIPVPFVPYGKVKIRFHASAGK